MRSEDFASLGLEGQREALDRLLERRSDLRDMVSELRSETGKRLLGRRKSALIEQRSKYVDIPTDGEPEKIVRLLIGVQSYEKYLAADIRSMEKPEVELEELDKDIALCKDAIVTSEKLARTGR